MNDPQIFADYYKSSFNSKLNWIKFTFNNLNNAEDALQDAYVYFFERYYDKWDINFSGLDTYFTNFLLMVLKAHLKLDKKVFILSLDSEYDSSYSLHETIPAVVEEKYEDSYILEKMRIVNNIINKAPEKYKNWYNLLLMFNNGIKYKDIALQENMKIGNVKNNISSVRKYIAKNYSRIVNKKVVFKKGSGIGTTNKDAIYYKKNRLKIKAKRDNKKLIII